MRSNLFGHDEANEAAAGGGLDQAIRRTDDSKPHQHRAMRGATKLLRISLLAQVRQDLAP
jgi:hypothetical protein